MAAQASGDGGCPGHLKLSVGPLVLLICPSLHLPKELQKVVLKKVYIENKLKTCQAHVNMILTWRAQIPLIGGMLGLN